jgi:outer membrane biosynthesis protein TonB
MMRSIGWPVIIMASAFGSGLATLGNFDSPFRPILAFWFMLICPGMAFVRLLRLEVHFAEWAIAIALSLALDTIVAEMMLLTKLWSPKWGLLALVYISLGGAFLQLIQSRGRQFVPGEDRIITSSDTWIFAASLIGFVLGTFLLVRVIGIPAPQQEPSVSLVTMTPPYTPTPNPTLTSTRAPSPQPTDTAALQPTRTPTVEPTDTPTLTTELTSTPRPTVEPTGTPRPTVEPTSTSTPTTEPTGTPTPAPTNTRAASAQPRLGTPTISPAPVTLAATPTPSATPDSTSAVLTGTITLLSPLYEDDPTHGPTTFEWRWSGPLPPDVGFEVRVWEEGQPEAGAHDAVLDNTNGNITRDGDTYRLNTDISNAFGVQGRTATYWWTVALVRISPSYADLGLQAAPEHLRFEALSPGNDQGGGGGGVGID